MITRTFPQKKSLLKGPGKLLLREVIHFAHEVLKFSCFRTSEDPLTQLKLALRLVWRLALTTTWRTHMRNMEKAVQKGTVTIMKLFYRGISKRNYFTAG